DTLSGGDGNDIIVLDENDIVADGGAGIDFLIGEGALDVLLKGLSGTASIRNMEAAIESSALDADRMIQLAAELLGRTGDAGKITADNLKGAGWTQDEGFAGEGYVQYTHADEDSGIQDGVVIIVMDCYA
ncbi:MAG: hypothetical protein IK129_01025, partial [Deltaproteobacteria bacterium]|nr:hypothetical protein [Deltaproteobacteria bacterium]